MKYKIFITIILFIFSFSLIKSGAYFIRENDSLMKIIKEKQAIYNIKPIDAIITKQTMIPGINGKKINIRKSYQKMKGINEFKESLLVFDPIKPNKTIDNAFDKVIISGNQTINKVSIITSIDNSFCYTEDLSIKKECIQNNKYTILIHRINHNYLSKIKELIQNGKIFFLDNVNNDELNLIIKYIKSINYKIVSINEVITE